MKNVFKSREKRVEFVKRKLLQNSFPRLQVSIILLLTALTGFLSSFLFLRLGISSMALRYPVSIVVAYCVFLLLLRVWIWLQKADFNLNVDLPTVDFGNSSSSSANTANSAFEFGGNADFGGGGAGGNWGESVSSGGSSSVLDGVSFDLDADELGLIILAVVAVIGGLLATFYIIYIAPILLAEILVDGILITGLYNRVKKIEQRYWLKTAIGKTLLPAVLAALFFGLAGFTMQKIVPEAHSVGAVWHNISSDNK